MRYYVYDLFVILPAITNTNSEIIAIFTYAFYLIKAQAPIILLGKIITVNDFLAYRQLARVDDEELFGHLAFFVTVRIRPRVNID